MMTTIYDFKNPLNMRVHVNIIFATRTECLLNFMKLIILEFTPLFYAFYYPLFILLNNI